MRRRRFAGVLAAAGIAVALVAAPIGQAKPAEAPGQSCQAFLEANPQIKVANARGVCAKLVARGVDLSEDDLPPELCDPVIGCVRPGPIS
jgi:hypothetical protein